MFRTKYLESLSLLKLTYQKYQYNMYASNGIFSHLWLISFSSFYKTMCILHSLLYEPKFFNKKDWNPRTSLSKLQLHMYSFHSIMPIKIIKSLPLGHLLSQSLFWWSIVFFKADFFRVFLLLWHVTLTVHYYHWMVFYRSWVI